jgi:hypothetical protein
MLSPKPDPKRVQRKAWLIAATSIGSVLDGSPSLGGSPSIESQSARKTGPGIRQDFEVFSAEMDCRRRKARSEKDWIDRAREKLPRLARRMDKVPLVHSWQGKSGRHDIGSQHAASGFLPLRGGRAKQIFRKQVE